MASFSLHIHKYKGGKNLLRLDVLKISPFRCYIVTTSPKIFCVCLSFFRRT